MNARSTRSGWSWRQPPWIGAATAMMILFATAAVTACGGGGGGNPGGKRAGFGPRGMVSTDFGGDDVANAIAVQGDGRIVAAGGNRSEFALARYTRDGHLDRSFGLRGEVVTHVGPPPVGSGPDERGGAEAIAIQPDAKIVVAGGVGGEFALARYTRGGHLDPSFGAEGKVVTDVGGRQGGPRTELLGAKAIALQADGKIVAAGAGPRHFALARYTSDGHLDASFGPGGVVVTTVGGADAAEAIVVQADGRIVVAGWSDFAFAVARYLPSGQLDGTFGTDGKVVTKAGEDDFDSAEAVAVELDGKIVVAGGTGPRFPAAVLVRYTSAGKLDPSFGRRGVATGLNVATAVAIQRDGRIVVAGGANYPADPCCSTRMEHIVTLLRYTRSGRPDRTFGNGGAVVTRPRCARGKNPAALRVSALAIRTDGRLIVAGGCGREGRRDFLLVRYRPDGRIG